MIIYLSFPAHCNNVSFGVAIRRSYRIQIGMDFSTDFLSKADCFTRSIVSDIFVSNGYSCPSSMESSNESTTKSRSSSSLCSLSVHDGVIHCEGRSCHSRAQRR